MSKTLAKVATLDGNSAVAKVAYHMSETAFIFPITPSTPMGEMADAWSVQGKKNAFGDTLTIRQMQSEAGVAGAVHGSCVNGSITSTFTSSQGLLLMIPNMFKIAGELNPCVFHVPARSIGGQAANIFNDHTDVMTAARPSGFAMLNSTDVQEAHDLALIAHVASLKASLPFLHFFDGMRTSHEIQKISVIPEAVMDEMVPHDAIAAFRKKSTHPEHPTYRGTLQGPDTYMQGVERGEEYYRKLPGIVQAAMDEFAEKTGRHYHLFDYVGHPKADKVVVVLGSAACAAEEAVDALNARGQKVGLVKVRLFRPFDADAFMASLPKSVKSIAVLDRVKEAGAFAQPLFGEVSAAIQLAEKKCTTVGGRFGLGGRDTSPADIMAVFKHLEQKKPAHNFTVGINDDICHTNLARYPEEIDCVPEGTVQCMFWGLGSDGTVGANKSAIKTLGENTDLYAQGYFSYDAKKSGGITISHLRFGPKPIKSAYMIRTADYVACHQPSYMGRYGPQIVRPLRERGTFVLNAPWKTVEELEAHIPADVRRTLAEKNAQFFVVDAAALAESVGLTGRVNNIMQAAFYQLANVLPIEEAISLLKGDIEKSFKIKGQDVVERNWKAVDAALGGLVKVDIPEHWRKAEASEDTVHGIEDPFADTPEDTEFFRTVARPIQRMQGASLPVSIMPEGGQIPNGSSKYEKRSIAYTIPIWNPDNCIQCNLCSLSCPHAAIRPYLLTQEQADAAPEGFTTINAKPKKLGAQFRIQPSPLDCVGCGLCIEQCPADALSFDLLDKVKEEQKKLYAYANDLPLREDAMDKFSVKGSQFQKPLLEFSGACQGCGETIVVKAMTQLFGKRMAIQSASGCNGVWAGSFPMPAYENHVDGTGPAFGNSLFEDNAEYCYGQAVSYRHRRNRHAEVVRRVLDQNIDGELAGLLSDWLAVKDVGDESQIVGHKVRDYLITHPELCEHADVKELLDNADVFTKISFWALGGDGWANDIGYGGLDHVMASGEDVNVMIMDTQVYSNTGGQKSKATPLSAVAKFAEGGQDKASKDICSMMLGYDNVYVAQVSMADPAHMLRCLKEAESFPGPSLINYLSPCIGWGVAGGLAKNVETAKHMVAAGMWNLWSYDPRKGDTTADRVEIASEPTFDLETVMNEQLRFHTLKGAHRDELVAALEKDVRKKWGKLQALKEMQV